MPLHGAEGMDDRSAVDRTRRPGVFDEALKVERNSAATEEVEKCFMVESDDLQVISARIRKLADARLATGVPYLLSQLGKDLGTDVRRLKILTGKPLAEYVSEIASDEYTIVQTGTHNNVQALVRAVKSSHDAPYEDSGMQTPIVPKEPRYNHRFWAAFSVPLIMGRRFLNMEDFTFQDASSPPKEGLLEIDHTLICLDGVPDRDNLIKDNIRKWVDQNDLPIEMFFSKSPSKVNAATHPAPGRSVLEAMIATLDKRQMANTTLTLDVVADLLRRRM